MNWNLIITYIMRAVAMLLVIPVHEAAHAWAANKLGDPTAKNYGRMSLNPLRHFDPLGALCMVLVGFGWAKPVPIGANRFRNPKMGMALSAAAGPASNLIMAYLSIILFKLTYKVLPIGMPLLLVTSFFSVLAQLNITLGVFNMLPVPPLDGSRIFGIFLPQRWYFGIMRYERYILLAVFALLWMGVLDAPLSAINNVVWVALDTLSGFIRL